MHPTHDVIFKDLSLIKYHVCYIKANIRDARVTLAVMIRPIQMKSWTLDNVFILPWFSD